MSSKSHEYYSKARSWLQPSFAKFQNLQEFQTYKDNREMRRTKDPV